MTYILVTATYPPDQLENTAKTFVATHVTYPSFLKKLVDMSAAGKKYKNLVLFQCDGSKVMDAINVIWKRYHKVTTVHDFKYKIDVYEDTSDPMGMLK